MSRSSSSIAFSYVVIDTFFKISSPTTSAVRNVALFGLPEIGPVSLSTSSTVRPCSIARFIAVIIP